MQHDFMLPSSVRQVENTVVAGKLSIIRATSGRHADGGAWCAYDSSGTSMVAPPLEAVSAPPPLAEASFEEPSEAVDNSSLLFIVKISRPLSCFFNVRSILHCAGGVCGVYIL